MSDGHPGLPTLVTQSASLLTLLSSASVHRRGETPGEGILREDVIRLEEYTKEETFTWQNELNGIK